MDTTAAISSTHELFTPWHKWANPHRPETALRSDTILDWQMEADKAISYIASQWTQTWSNLKQSAKAAEEQSQKCTCGVALESADHCHQSWQQRGTLTVAQTLSGCILLSRLQQHAAGQLHSRAATQLDSYAVKKRKERKQKITATQ